MRDKIIKLVRSPDPKKKYRAIIQRGDRRVSVDFGGRGYEQYKDSTGKGFYTRKNHGDKSRRRNYFLRHSGVPTKTEALKVENKKNPGVWTARKLSHKYLW